MIQLILHLLGDYFLQSHWMAINKTKSFLPAFLHATLYSLPFFFVGSWKAVLFIAVTHFFIDRYRLARYVVFAKEHLSPVSEWKSWEDSKWTGYEQEGKDSPPMFMAVWLMIITDNTLHLCCNFFALWLL